MITYVTFRILFPCRLLPGDLCGAGASEPLHHPRKQCLGSVIFFCGSESKPKADPDPDPGRILTKIQIFEIS